MFSFITLLYSIAQPPVPVSDWEGILDAREDGPACIHVPPLTEVTILKKCDFKMNRLYHDKALKKYE